MMGLALMLLMASSIVSTVNFLVTIFRLRAPGMSLMRLPLFTWGWIFTSLLMLWAFPAFVSALSLLVADRAFGTVFFTSTQGGPLLWDHMFWFFGHPEVYVLLLPGFAIVGDLFSTFSRRPLRSEEHTSELQSHLNLVCRLLLEKKKKTKTKTNTLKKKKQNKTYIK